MGPSGGEVECRWGALAHLCGMVGKQVHRSRGQMGRVHTGGTFGIAGEGILITVFRVRV